MDFSKRSPIYVFSFTEFITYKLCCQSCSLAIPLAVDHAELFSEELFMTGVINLHVALSFILSQI